MDVNGKHSAAATKPVGSSFSVKKARFQTKVQITDKAEGILLLNLADFMGDPKNKVLEFATLKYNFSDYFRLQVGQFRPYFGLEDLYAEDFLRSLDWSNQYAAYSANGWQSFQIGASVFGEIKNLKIPVKYYIGIFNGNGKNQPTDNDNGKQIPARVELALRPHTKLGLNGGIGKDNGNKLWAMNFDLAHTSSLGGPWSVQVQSEFKRGINNAYYATLGIEAKAKEPIKECLLSGYYILPNIVYKVNSKDIKSVEVSFRYENFNPDILHNGNVRKSYIPMLSTSFVEDYSLRLQVGLEIDKFAKDIANTYEYGNTRFICQLQARF